MGNINEKKTKILYALLTMLCNKCARFWREDPNLSDDIEDVGTESRNLHKRLIAEKHLRNGVKEMKKLYLDFETYYDAHYSLRK